MDLRSQLPHEIVNLVFTITYENNQLKILWVDFLKKMKNALCEIESGDTPKDQNSWVERASGRSERQEDQSTNSHCSLSATALERA